MRNVTEKFEMAIAQQFLNEYSTEHKNFCSYERKDQGMYKVKEIGISVIPFLAPWTMFRGLELDGIIFLWYSG